MPVWVPIVCSILSAALAGFLSWLAHKHTAAFYYGRLTERVEGHAQRVTTLENHDRDHETRISHLETSKKTA